MSSGKRKFRGHKKYKLPKKLVVPVKQAKTKEIEIQFDHEFPLADTERLKYVYVRNLRGIIINIICVAYDMQINNEWITIIYYDSEHGSLHRHETISFENRDDLVTEDKVKKKGTAEDWLTWAINDIIRKYTYYRKHFLKRSKINIDNI